MNTIHARARLFLASPFLADQPVAVQRAASELRHALREPLTPDTARRLLSVLAGLDMTRAESMRGEASGIAREVLETNPATRGAKARVAVNVAPDGPLESVGRAAFEASRQAVEGYRMLAEMGAPRADGCASPIGPVIDTTPHKTGETSIPARAMPAAGPFPILGIVQRVNLVANTVRVAGCDFPQDGTVTGHHIGLHVAVGTDGRATMRTNAPPAVDAGEGYRLLVEGEEIRLTDESYRRGLGWGPVSRADGGVQRDYQHVPMRRRVEGPRVGETWRDLLCGGNGTDYYVYGIDHEHGIDSGTLVVWATLVRVGGNSRGFRVPIESMTGNRWQRVTP